MGTRSLRLLQFPKPRSSEQVAAICYRVRNGAVEILLVKSGAGRWIFPKGGIEPGLTHAQSAALEAFEEAGVHGRIEATAFTSYIGRKRIRKQDTELSVRAHLCEVLRRERPQENGRKPKWFRVDAAKGRLLEGRTRRDGIELAQVVDRALDRIREVRRNSSVPLVVQKRDPLQKIALEAAEIHRGIHQISAKYFRYARTGRASQEPRSNARSGLSRQILQLGP